MSDTETPPAYEELFPERDEASQVVASPHLLHLGGGGVCGGQVSFGW